MTTIPLGMPTVRPHPATTPEDPLRWGPTLRERLGFAPATNRYATARPETAELIESANR